MKDVRRIESTWSCLHVIMIELTHATDFLLFVGSFLPLWGKKEPTKEEKYHAAVRPELVEGQAGIAFAYVLYESNA